MEANYPALTEDPEAKQENQSRREVEQSDSDGAETRLSIYSRMKRSIAIQRWKTQQKHATRNNIKKDTEWWEIEPFGSQDPWTLKWDGVIIAFALFNAIFIPLDFGFPDISELINANKVYQAFNIISYFVFLIDIFINFNMSYFNSDGEEINDRR